MAITYDIRALKALGVTDRQFAEWIAMTTCSSLHQAHRMMCDFYRNHGFDIFWACKDQQLANKGFKLSLKEKHQYIHNMLNLSTKEFMR